MQFVTSIKRIFRPSEKHKGIWPIKIYVLKLFFFLMFVFVAKDAWAELISHKGDLNVEVAIAWCSIAAYTTLSGLGIFHTLKMLPILLFMLLYKGLFLFFVAYPLWSSGTLEGSEAEGWAQIFILIGIPILFTPWKYVFNTFVLGKD
ncbi:hypothetical protein [uncultured Maribacter sp.]|uniref:hypothetical protein n=1 Tax=uncultured Maribacter sp. TaxID=431308 RepID=UPI0030DCB9D0|tara:strand:+ start:1229 stop:1669 length:441 start_codon:yes stop_codon:yes gene_type:complete